MSVWVPARGYAAYRRPWGASEEHERSALAQLVAVLQGVYYFVTGVWPVVSIRTFLFVTGPKHDVWLVRTFGAFIATVGAALVAAGLRGRVALDTSVLGLGTAASLATADVVYVGKGRISVVYLLDAVANAALAAGWLGVWFRRVF